MCVFRSYLDMVKVFLFSYFFWLVLCLIFITGTTRINIFCLGYLVACFYFMLFGGTLLLQPVRYVLRLWDCLIAYTCVVISLKNLLSVRTHVSVLFTSVWMMSLYFIFTQTQHSDGGVLRTRKRQHQVHLDSIQMSNKQCVCVIVCQLGSCAYLDGLQIHGCWLIQAFSMFCTINGYNLRE